MMQPESPEPDLSRLFPRGIEAAAARVLPGAVAKFPLEAKAVAEAVASRRDEFLSGRELARRLLARIEVPELPILSGRRREPLWPTGVVGSIAHADAMCVSAVARRSEYAALGIDIEPNQPLEPEVIDAICVPDELDALPPGPAADPARLIFSAKECIYKTLFPLTRAEFEFKQVRLRWDPSAAEFAVGEIIPKLADLGARLSGAYHVAEGWIITGAWLSAAAHKAP